MNNCGSSRDAYDKFGEPGMQIRFHGSRTLNQEYLKKIWKSEGYINIPQGISFNLFRKNLLRLSSERTAKMLILIAGITGMVGQPCAKAAILRGHEVRGIGRDPAKLPTEIRQNLEGFVVSSGIYDIPSLDRAVANVDAVICAYGFLPEVLVEGQLTFLRAAERAGVKVGKTLEYTNQT